MTDYGAYTYERTIPRAHDAKEWKWERTLGFFTTTRRLGRKSL
ncbi:hypothetical protein R3Q06_20995 [Rhodococcus erythropolis]|nr:hypothetical protein [Rhodococcus erythropolis]MDV6275976.1 hypothetical protein [Rhodococcus erythropolis]